jgi:hypothetical protein
VPWIRGHLDLEAIGIHENISSQDKVTDIE